jgi:hypothetical protein
MTTTAALILEVNVQIHTMIRKWWFIIQYIKIRVLLDIFIAIYYDLTSDLGVHGSCGISTVQ